MKNLGYIIKCVRKFHLQQGRELAQKIGISQSYLSEIESDKKAPSLELLEKLSKEWGLFPWALIQLAYSYERDQMPCSTDKAETLFQWFRELRERP